jgi:hypothetical protein
MDKCHTQSSEKFAQERVIVVLPIKLITFNDFYLLKSDVDIERMD